MPAPIHPAKRRAGIILRRIGPIPLASRKRDPNVKNMKMPKSTKASAATTIFKRALLLLLAFFPMTGCVSTPQGAKFDPIEGARRFDEKLDATIDRLGDRSYHDDD